MLVVERPFALFLRKAGGETLVEGAHAKPIDPQIIARVNIRGCGLFSSFFVVELRRAPTNRQLPVR